MKVIRHEYRLVDEGYLPEKTEQYRMERRIRVFGIPAFWVRVPGTNFDTRNDAVNAYIRATDFSGKKANRKL
jgi:hypothetical protein